MSECCGHSPDTSPPALANQCKMAIDGGGMYSSVKMGAKFAEKDYSFNSLNA